MGEPCGSRTAATSRARSPATRYVVAGSILRYINDNHLAEGDMLPSQTRLASILHVSLGLLRESLSMLESRGVVTIHPGRGGGVRVHGPNADAVARDLALIIHWDGRSITEMVEAQRMVEVACVQVLCAESSAETIESLRAAASWRGAGRMDIDGYKSFHRILVARTGNWVVLQLYDGLHRAVHEILHVPPGMSSEEHRVCTLAHQRIVDAVAAGDFPAAERRVSRHMRAHLDYMLRGRPVSFDGVASR